MRGFRVFAGVALLGFAASPALAARDICEILRDKGVLKDDVEFNECRSAQEKKDAEAETRARESTLAEVVKEVRKGIEWLDRFTLYGDARIRYEGMFQNGEDARNRERMRLRLGSKIRISDEIEGGLRVVTGDPSDPVSTNQTMSDLFTKKSVSLDTVYITARPWKSIGLDRPWFSLTGGKLPVVVFRPRAGSVSELVFDDDLTPEGFSQDLLAIDSKSEALRKLQFTTVQWSLKENAKGEDAWIFGGQGLVDLAPASGVGLTLALGDYYYRDADQVALERNTNNTKLMMTNSVVLKDGSVCGGMPIDQCLNPATGKARFQPDKNKDDYNPITGFRDGFNVLNPSAQLTIATWDPAWPVTIIGDLAYNTEADHGNNLGFVVGAGIGQTKNQGDWALSAAYLYTETDAVPSVFSFSDMGRNGGTNVQGPILRVDYVPLPRVTLTAKNHFVAPIDTSYGQSSSEVYRLQLDAVVAF